MIGTRQVDIAPRNAYFTFDYTRQPRMTKCWSRKVGRNRELVSWFSPSTLKTIFTTVQDLIEQEVRCSQSDARSSY